MSGPLFPSTLLPLAQYSSSAGAVTTGNVIVHRGTPLNAAFTVKVDGAPSSAGFGSATLDVYVQHSVDYLLAGPSSSNFSATWDDFAHIAHFDMSGARASTNANWLSSTAPGSSVNPHVAATQSLAAQVIQHGPTGAAWRAVAVVTNSPTVPSSSCWKVGVYAQVVYP